MTKIANKELLSKLVPLQRKKGPITITLTPDELETIVEMVQRQSPINSRVMIKQNDDCYSVLDVSKIFQVTRQAVYKWIEEDKIKYHRRMPGSRDIRIPKDQFKKVVSPKEEFLRRHQEIFGSAKITLTNPSEVFRSGEVTDD